MCLICPIKGKNHRLSLLILRKLSWKPDTISKKNLSQPKFQLNNLKFNLNPNPRYNHHHLNLSLPLFLSVTFYFNAAKIEVPQPAPQVIMS